LNSALSVEQLLSAYAAGIFPMADTRHSRNFYWVEPEWRGIIPLNGFHIPRRLQSLLRQQPFDIFCNRDFAGVIKACAAPTPKRPETWINKVIKEAYQQLYEAGHAYSVECWQNGQLVGGVYGVSLGSAFFGESMFSLVPNSSKVALCHLALRLRLGGYSLLDTQFLTNHLKQFGGIEIAQAAYLKLLSESLQKTAQFPYLVTGAELLGWIQSINQKS